MLTPRSPPRVGSPSRGSSSRPGRVRSPSHRTTAGCSESGPADGGSAPRLHDFAGYLDDSETSDVVFEVDGQTLRAHRIVLLCSCASDVFRAMLRHPMREATSAAIKIEGIEYATFRLLVEYIYTGSVDVPAHLALPLLLACEQYLVHPLQLQCARMVAQNVCTETLWDTLAVAASLQLPPPADAPAEQPTPAEVLREAAASFVCLSASLPELAGADSFAAFRDEVVPRMHDLLHAKLQQLLLVNTAGAE